MGINVSLGGESVFDALLVLYKLIDCSQLLVAFFVGIFVEIFAKFSAVVVLLLGLLLLLLGLQLQVLDDAINLGQRL